MKKFFARFKNFKANQAGGVTAIVAMVIPILVVIIGFGVDWNYSSISKHKYSTFGLEVLSQKTVTRATTESEIISWLDSGYNLAGMQREEIKITPNTSGDTFNVDVKFKSKSLFSSFGQGTWTSTFTYPYSQDNNGTGVVADRPFYLDIGLRNNKAVFQTSFSEYISTLPGFENLIGSSFEMVPPIPSSSSDQIQMQSVKVTSGNVVKTLQFPMLRFNSGTWYNQQNFTGLSIGFFNVTRMNGGNQLSIRCNLSNIKDYYNLTNLAVPSKLYFKGNGNSYSEFIVDVFGAQNERGACEGQVLRSEVEKIELPKEIVIYNDAFKGMSKNKAANEQTTGVELVLDTTRWWGGNGGAITTGSVFNGYTNRAIWKKITIKSSSLAHQGVDGIGWALWEVLKTGFDKNRILPMEFTHSRMKVSLLTESYGDSYNNKYGVRIGPDQWTKFHVVNGLVKPEYAGFTLQHIDSLNISKQQLFI